jgi:hypothetical protein
MTHETKQFKNYLLRIDPELWNEIKLWAEHENRSVNKHICFLLRKELNQLPTSIRTFNSNS